MLRGAKPLIFAAAIVGCGALSSHAALRYVDVNGVAPTQPYTNWATAANTIQDAIDISDPGDQILVTNGIYQTGGRAVYGLMTNRVAVDRPLLLASVNGPGVTIIQGYQVPGATNGDGAIRCAYLTNDAFLTGFTLTNGGTRAAGDPQHELMGGGVWCESSSAVVSNCVLAGNAAITYGNGCGGGAYSGTLNSCTIINNHARLGGGAYVSLLNSSLLIGNFAADSGGGAQGGILNSCTIVSNTAPGSGGSDSPLLITAPSAIMQLRPPTREARAARH